jgi:hypothetical protein
MIERLGDALQLPLATRNHLLTLAGFAARYPARQLDAREMAPIRAAIEYTLERHAPYPALAVDRLWTVVRMNDPAQSIFGQLGIREGDSLLDLMVSDALPRLIENWPDVAHHVAQRLRTESAAQGGVAALDEVARQLAQAPSRGATPLGPVVPTIYRAGSLRLSLFATIAQFGTPEDLTLDDLKIELYFPADLATRRALLDLAGVPATAGERRLTTSAKVGLACHAVMILRRDVRRRLEQYAAHPGCEANVLSAVHDVPMDAVARWVGLDPKVGQSPFAIARGQQFEASLFEKEGARLRAALIEKQVLPANSTGFLDLRITRNKGPMADIAASRGAFRELLAAFLREPRAAMGPQPSLVAGPSMSVPGKAILPDGLFSIDVLTVHLPENSARVELRVGEIKVYPDRGGYTDSTELASARAQAGLYVYALEAELQAWGLSDAFQVARDGFLVLTRPGSNQPSVRAGEDLRFQAERARAAFERLKDIAAKELPIDHGDKLVSPQRLAAIHEARTAYGEGCLSFCELADHCQARAIEAGLAGALGEDMKRFLGSISLHRALALLDGAPAETTAEKDFVKRAT